MSSDVTLKSCPFCGDKPIIEDGANDRPWVVQCINRDCPAQPFMDHADTKRQAIAAWNQRADAQGEPVAAQDVAALVEAYRTGNLVQIDREGMRERVARAMCAATGKDPDKLTPAPRGAIGMVPLWTLWATQADAANAAILGGEHDRAV